MWEDLAIPGPEQTARYYEQQWWRERTFTDDLCAAAASRPGHPAIIAYQDGKHAATLTYAELAAAVSRFASALAELGVGAGDVVVLYLPNVWQISALYLACNRLGAIASPVIPTLGARELGQVLAFSKAAVCITVDSFADTDYAARLAEVAPPGLRHQVIIGGPGRPPAISFGTFFEATDWENRHPLAGLPSPGPDQPSLLLYTSGTTGQMKAVAHSQNTLYAGLRGMHEPFGLSAGDVISIPHYFAHLAAVLCGAYMPLMLGATCVMQDSNTDMELLLDLIEQHRVSYLYAAPGYVVGLLEAHQRQRRDTGSLRFFVSGSAPIRPELITAVQDAFGVGLQALWGMTENGTVTITRPDDPPGWAARSDGRPLPWAQVRLAPIADAGEQDGSALLVRSASQCLGYLGQPGLYANCVDSGGWFDTGDLARDDGRGGIKIVGRQADLINRASGHMISTLEVESVLQTHPGVEEVVLVGYPDPDVPGAELAAAIVIAAGSPPTLTDLREHLADAQMAEVLWPDRLVNMRALPRNSLGKIQRSLLRERLEIAASPRR
ncbi:MAG TPA: AMP-binding protein [Streptosporangiaceae bacterium]|jgi:cyclohexanecarboxylate-CoA ligase